MCQTFEASLQEIDPRMCVNSGQGCSCTRRLMDKQRVKQFAAKLSDEIRLRVTWHADTLCAE